MEDPEQNDERRLVHGPVRNYPFNYSPPSTPPENVSKEYHGSAIMEMAVPIDRYEDLKIRGSCHVRGLECCLNFFFVKWKFQLPFELDQHYGNLNFEIQETHDHKKAQINIEYKARLNGYFATYLTGKDRVVFSFFVNNSALRHYHRLSRDLTPLNMTHYDMEDVDAIKRFMKKEYRYDGSYTVFIRADDGMPGIPMKGKLVWVNDHIDLHFCTKVISLDLPLYLADFLEPFEFTIEDNATKGIMFVKFCLELRMFTGIIESEEDQSILMTFFFHKPGLSWVDLIIRESM